ncbi:MAG TPA: HRDC domain-containing protein [Candidatus Limnocylindria bacterium]|nr:HRDC domain-containing protein [Candidatus Limnocylindria bacterium]
MSVEGADPVEGPEPPGDEAPPPVPLVEPRDGLPAPVTTPAGLAATVAAFAAGAGPVAVDAERASGYRYGQRAYLVQIRRAGAGTALVDPVGCPDLSSLGQALTGVEWVLHAATQDLPCLAEIGMRPTSLFDTELGGRLAGYPRVGLGPLVENVLGFALEKGHSAADWSTRPLPEPWLRYAALDVEVLVELRDAVADDLDRQGKLGWAEEEFAAILAAPPAAMRIDPWRRTSGLHRVRGRRGLAAVRSLWEARDAMARRRDVAPGRVLPDSAIVEAALAAPTSSSVLLTVPGFSGRATRRHVDLWYDALARAATLPDSELPEVALSSDAPPPARAWADRDPAAAARLNAARTAVAAVADEHRLPVENLLSPDTVRRLCWTPPADLAEDSIGAVLAAHGARPWQQGLTAPVLARALQRLRTKGMA